MNLFESLKDLSIIDAAPALGTFFTNIAANKGDMLKNIATLTQLQGNLAQAGVQLEGDAIGLVASGINTEIANLVAQAQADLAKQLATPAQVKPLNP